MRLLLLPLNHLRRALEIPAKPATGVVSRALTTQNVYHYSDPVDDLVFCNVEIDGLYEKLSEFELLARSVQRGSLSDPQVLNKVVSFCARLACLDVGIQIHTVIVKMGFCSNVFICSALVDMYGKCRKLGNARKVFDEMPQRNVVTWNSLISGCLLDECPKMAIGLFVKMLKEGIAPTEFSLSGILVGCSQLEEEEFGIQVHGLSLKLGFCWNVVVGTGLVDVYSRCSRIDDSRQVFDRMPWKNVFTWTSMVNGYAQNEQPDESMALVREMLRLDFRPNYVTFNGLLSSFYSPDFWDYCRQTHCLIIKDGLELNAYISVSLMSAYSKCSDSLEDFQKLFSCVTRWDLISWNTVIAGFSNLGAAKQTLKCFSEMRRIGLNADGFTLASVLGAVSAISALEEGKQMHALVCKSGCASSIYVQNGLLSMYARGGAISDSKHVFKFMEEHDVISWNSLLSGCAHHGLCWETVELFELMRTTGIKPNDTTFLILLTACSHVGLLDKGLEYFNLMRNKDLLVSPRMEHYATIVDLFGRAGNLHEAEEFIDSMPVKPGPSVYKALLSACQVHGNADVAFRCARNLLELCPNDPATYVLLANSLVTKGCWDDAAGLWKLMLDRGVRKHPGCSWV